MSPFPQSVADSSTSPAVVSLPPAVIRWSLVNSAIQSISSGHAGSVDKVS